MKPLAVGNNYHPEVLGHFNSDTETHGMTILHEEGLYRHLRFTKPGTGLGWFSIITSPGQLMVWGDHGCHVFAREQDMFPWFRGSYVNADYWAEKLIAVDRHGPARRYDEELFKKWIIRDFWERRTEYEPDVAKAIWTDIKDDILDDYTDRSTADAAYNLVANFKIVIRYPDAFTFRYDDVYESVESWSGWDYHFIWNCHAILSGIRHYDESKVPA